MGKRTEKRNSDRFSLDNNNLLGLTPFILVIEIFNFFHEAQLWKQMEIFINEDLTVVGYQFGSMLLYSLSSFHRRNE